MNRVHSKAVPAHTYSKTCLGEDVSSFSCFFSGIYPIARIRFLFPSPLQDQGTLQKVCISNTIAELCYSWLNWILKSSRLSLKWQQQISPNLVLHWLSHAFIATFHNKLAYSCISGAMPLSESVICSSPNDWYVGGLLIACFLFFVFVTSGEIKAFQILQINLKLT